WVLSLTRGFYPLVDEINVSGLGTSSSPASPPSTPVPRLR
ncbi:MAG: hypothetical protein AVDCRST_MAG55-1636, partial [uncultured Rubrobacteraceae bacterium]